MKRLLASTEPAEAQARRSLEVIDQFDRLVAEQASLEELVGLAATLGGACAGVRDTLTDRVVTAAPGGAPPSGVDEMARAVGAAVVGERVRGRHHRLLELDGVTVAAASVETATGRSGFAWLVLDDRAPPDALTALVVERLAAAASIASLREHERRSAEARIDPAALERLLAGAVQGPEAAALAARQAGLDAGRRWRVLVARARPAGAASPEAQLAMLVRATHAAGLGARGVVLERRPAVVAEARAPLGEALEAACAAADGVGFALDVGLGEEADLQRLAVSLAQAREALALGGLAAEDRSVTSFSDLGILHLLAQVPSEEIAASPDVQQIAALDSASGGLSDLRLLEVYCETSSMRQTGARLFVHHSSVDYRLRRIAEALGVDLGEAKERMRLLIAIKLLRIDRLREG